MPNPFADIGTCVLEALGAHSAILVRRFGGGSWDAATGRYTGSVSADVPTDAAVQPSTPKEIEKLPENERTKQAITVYTRARLMTSDISDQDKADQISYAGELWEVQVSEDWTRQAQYALAIATRMGA